MRKKNEITEYVAAALIFVCAVAVSLGIFLVCTQNSIERNSQKVIKTNVSRQSEHIKAILDIHYGYLRGIAKEIGKSEELVLDENMEMLISLEEETALERTALIEADGTAHYDNGAEKNVSSRRYFKEGMEGKETLSDPLESSVDKETRVILGVPVWKNGKVIGVLGGSYNVTALSRMLFNDFFEDVGYTLITTNPANNISFTKMFMKHFTKFVQDFVPCNVSIYIIYFLKMIHIHDHKSSRFLRVFLQNIMDPFFCTSLIVRAGQCICLGCLNKLFIL